MLDSVIAWFNAVEGFLLNPSVSRAVLAGFLVSFAVTQNIKKFWLPKDWPDAKHKRYTVAVAFVFGFWPVYALAPIPASESVLWAVMVGFASPSVYTAAVKLLYHFWPFLEPKLSARPVIKHREDGAVGVKYGDDKTEWTQPKK